LWRFKVAVCGGDRGGGCLAVMVGEAWPSMAEAVASRRRTENGGGDRRGGWGKRERRG